MIIAHNPPEEVDRFWPQIEPMLAKAVAYSNGRHDTQDIYFGVSCGKLQLWIIADDGKVCAACISEIRDYPAKRYLNVLFCGGSVRSALHLSSELSDKLKEFALYNRCDGMELAGRPGWERLLMPRGWKKSKAIIMEIGL
jgi:hypothetical protein